MTVYVDDMYLYPLGEFKRGPYTYKMSHMIADTEAELHAMARQIGVKRQWYQDDHYDVTMTMRTKAIAAGVVTITLRQCSAMMMERREGRPLPKPEDAEALRHDAYERRKTNGTTP